MKTIKHITNYIEELAPLAYAEDFDNVGLLVGNYNTTVTGILVTLDTLETSIGTRVKLESNEAQREKLIVRARPL